VEALDSTLRETRFGRGYDRVIRPTVWWRFDVIYSLTVIVLIPGGSSTVYIYTKTIHRTQWNRKHRTEHT